MPHSYIRNRWRGLLAALLVLGTPPAVADIEVALTGVEGELRSNVLTFLSVERYRRRDDLDEDTMQRMVDRVDSEVKRALRPLGYYDPKVTASHRAVSGGWQVSIA